MCKSNDGESKRTGNPWTERRGHWLQALSWVQSLKFTLELAVETVHQAEVDSPGPSPLPDKPSGIVTAILQVYLA